ADGGGAGVLSRGAAAQSGLRPGARGDGIARRGPRAALRLRGAGGGGAVLLGGRGAVRTRGAAAGVRPWRHLTRNAHLQGMRFALIALIVACGSPSAPPPASSAAPSPPEPGWVTAYRE